MRGKRTTGLAQAVLVLAATGLGSIGPATAAETGAIDKPIKLAINEWTGQHVSTHIAGEMLKSAGYRVEYVTAVYMNGTSGICVGSLA